MHFYRYKVVTVGVSSVIRIRWEYGKIQWIKQVLRIFGSEFIRSDEFKTTAQFAFFWLLNFLQKRCFIHKNSLASCQRCRHSVEPRALTCPFKQSNLSFWSLLSWHPTHKYLWGRVCFFQICRLLSTVTVTLRFVIWHFRTYCLVQIVSLGSLSIGFGIIFTINVLVDRIKNFKWNVSPND